MKALFLMTTLMCSLCVHAESWKPDVRWRGFNLSNMFWGPNAKPFEEEDFKWIHEMGFNFVRLPMDYRAWIKDGDWEQFDEARLAWIDEAIRLGQKHGVHVQLCFHRAPGYTVAQPPEPRDLFSDAEALRVCAKHWGTFAKRYKEVSPKDLSFNLFNEPGKISEEAYATVATELVRVIRAENPERLIVADGRSWGDKPTASLVPLGIGQALRGYIPMSVSHHMAPWINPMSTVTPAWPPSEAVTPLYGRHKAPWDVPLVISGEMSGTLAIRFGRVSGKVTFRVEADDKILANHILDPKEGEEGWANVVFQKEWNIAQGDCTSTLTLPLPGTVRRLRISVAEGDWVALRDVTLTEGDKTVLLPFQNVWGKTNPPLLFKGFGATPEFQPASEEMSRGMTGEAYLRKEVIEPWQEMVDAGVFVMVGEFGSFSHTPHDVVLAWMEDYLKNWKAMGWGWALWNFKGSFGILDSERKDVEYETFNGHKLDRKMLELLQRY